MPASFAFCGQVWKAATVGCFLFVLVGVGRSSAYNVSQRFPHAPAVYRLRVDHAARALGGKQDMGVNGIWEL